MYIKFTFLFLLCISCASGGQDQVQEQADNQNDFDEEENAQLENYQGNQTNQQGENQGSNYGNQQGQENEFDQFDGDAETANAAVNAAPEAGPKIDEEASELVENVPLELGNTNAAAPVANAPVEEPAVANPSAVPSVPAPVSSNVAAVNPATAPALAAPVAMPMAPVPAEVMPLENTLWWIAYDFDRKNKNLRVQILTKGRPEYDVFEEINQAKQSEIIVRFYSTQVRPSMRWPVDATEFRSPVAYVRTKEDTLTMQVDVVLTLREKVKPLLFAKRGNVQLTFPIADKYFSGAKDPRLVEYVAESIEVASVLPDMREDSDPPKTKVLNKMPFIPNPTRNAFKNGTELSGNKKNAGIVEGAVDDKGLPVSDFPASEEGLMEALTRLEKTSEKESEENATQVPAEQPTPEQVTPPAEPAIPASGTQNGAGLHRVRDFHVLAVAQDVPPAANMAAEVAEPAMSADQLDMGVAAPNAETQVLSESTVPAPEVSAVPEVTGTSIDTSGQSYTGKPVVLEFHNAPLGEVLKAFSEQMGANFVFTSAVGTLPISIKLRNVPWDAALDAILDTYQLAMAKVSDQVIRIDLIKNMSDYLALREQMTQIRTLSEPRKILMVRLSHAKVVDDGVVDKLTKFFQVAGITNNRTSINADERTNTLYIEAPPGILERAKALIQKLDVPEPQVEIVSRIIEVTRQATNFMGISWASGANLDPGRGLGFGTLNFPNYMTSTYSVDPGVNSQNSAGTASFNIGSINDVLDIGLRLKMEETKGTTEILQSNRVVVSDNQAASIVAGQRAYFRSAAAPIVVGAVQQQGATGSVPQGGGGVTDVSFNLSLNVTPQVTNDGHVYLELDISSSVPAPAPLAGSDMSSSNRQLQTKLKKKSSETAVIGGVYDTKKTKREVGVPFLSKLPIIGALFRSTDISESQTELMIMITPTILEKDTEQMQAESFAPAASSAVVENYSQGQQNSGQQYSNQAANTYQSNQEGNVQQSNQQQEALNQQNSENLNEQSLNQGNSLEL